MSEDRAGEDMSAKAGFPAPGERVGLPALTGQWHFDTLWIALLGIHGPVTAARPRRFCTAFPHGGLRHYPQWRLLPLTPLLLEVYPTGWKGSKGRF